MPASLDTFKEVWLVDFEFNAPAGERPSPICMVAREWRTGRTLRLGQDELLGPTDTSVSAGAGGPVCRLLCFC